MTPTKKQAKVTKAQATEVLNQVAAWMGKHGYGTPTCPHGKALDDGRFWLHADDATECVGQTFGPAPTGPEAAYHAEGPELRMDWDWPSSGPTPTVILEGGPYDWAYEVSGQIKVDGVFVEPYAGWALCIYPAF